MENKEDLICIVGDSGSGKTFIQNGMYDNGYEKIVSHTTRLPRAGEINGVDYYFVTKEEFEKIHFLEQVEVHGNKYGVSKEELDSKTKDVVLVVEPNGVEQILAQRKAIVILLDIDKETRKQNMIGRGDTIENIEYRLQNEDFKKDLKDKNITPDIIIDRMVGDVKEVIEMIEKYKSMNSLELN